MNIYQIKKQTSDIALLKAKLLGCSKLLVDDDVIKLLDKILQTNISFYVSLMSKKEKMDIIKKCNNI